MQSRRDPLDPFPWLEPEGAPSPRPPQFNRSYCRYPCGCGCCEPMDGDSEGDGGGGSRVSDSESGNTTLIGNHAQNMSMERAPTQRNYVVSGTPRPEGLPILGEIERQTGMVILTNRFDEIVVVTRTSSDNHSSQMQSYERVLDSLLPELSSGYVSTRHSSARSRGRPSPMSPGLGFPTWVEDNQISPLPPVYHFLHPPLRLSPQDGLIREPSIDMGDEQDPESLWLFLEQHDREQATRDRLFV